MEAVVELERAINLNPVVKIAQGELRGSFADGVNSFKGIPYAAAPFGVNRLLPPLKAEPWKGVRDALAYGPKAPQVPFPSPWDVLLADLAEPGEDCLNLNIWSGDLESPGQPVIVWIPGGMFESGTAAMSTYDGSRFARDGVVCVTINYRVGADGFLCLEDVHGNLGLLDQIAALEWVRANIAAFGGDRENVTLVGQSAGAMSVGTLLSMPRAEGLFHRVIVQSGGAHQVISAETGLRAGRRLAEIMEVPATREAVAGVPLDRMLQAQMQLKSELIANPDPTRWGREIAINVQPWQPVIDGVNIPEHPMNRINRGIGAEIDMLVGSNLDEWNFFLVPGGMIGHIPDDMLAMVIAGYGLPVQTTLDTYRASHPGADASELLSAIQGDWYFRMPALRLADAHAKSSQSSTYMYEFAWRSPQFDGKLGAAHGLEIPFVFDTLDTGDDPLIGKTGPQDLADLMHADWVAFATHGKCSWPKYDLRRRATMRYDANSEVVYDPRPAERVLWEGVR